MKGVLEFNLPDEAYEFKVASSAAGLCIVIWDVERNLLATLEDEEHSLEYTEGIKDALKILRDICEEQGLREVLQ